MMLQKASPADFSRIRAFYWDLIDEMQAEKDKIGWKKGIYPADDFLKESLAKGELYVFPMGKTIGASVILNSQSNAGYAGVPWSLSCPEDAVLIPHALAVSPKQQGKGIGEQVVKGIFAMAKAGKKKAVRLDILGTNTAAEKLYTKCGFRFVQEKTMYYADTGWAAYRMFEWNV